MPEALPLPSAEHSAEKANQVRDMAARLFADLFYKQVMAEREQKRRDRAAQNLTTDPTKIYDKPNEQETNDN